MKKQKSLTKLKAELWKHFSLFIKLRASSDGVNCKCFTCGKPLKIGTPNCQAGHYYSQGGFRALRWNEMNVQVQCWHCNINLYGNTQIFRERLISEYGESAVTLLDVMRHGTLNLDRDNYEGMIEYYKKKVDELKKTSGK
jgi:hypothetical protein